jgi:hypothetical protein
VLGKEGEDSGVSESGLEGKKKEVDLELEGGGGGGGVCWARHVEMLFTGFQQLVDVECKGGL